MKLTPEQYKLVEREWQARRHSYSTKLVHDAEEQQLLFRHAPDADMYVYVPCPVCGERRYTVFHERTAIRMRTVFGNRPLTAAAHRGLAAATHTLGVDRTAKLASFLLRRNITPQKVTNVNRLGYTVVQCIDCGLLRRNPTYLPKALEAAYNNNYLKFLSGEYTAGRQRRYAEVLGDLGFAAATRDFPRKRILDVGCGYGLFLNHIAQHGWEPWGVDFAADCIDYARTHFGLDNVAVGNLDSDSFEPDFFDAVTLWSVAAHLDDPIRMFSDIRRVLRPGGLLIVYTVNAASLQHRLKLERWEGFTRNHLVFFSKHTLTTALGKAGFDSVTDHCDPDLARQWANQGLIDVEHLDFFRDKAGNENLAPMLAVLAR